MNFTRQQALLVELGYLDDRIEQTKATLHASAQARRATLLELRRYYRSTSEMADDLGFTRQRLNKLLREAGFPRTYRERTGSGG